MLRRWCLILVGALATLATSQAAPAVADVRMVPQLGHSQPVHTIELAAAGNVVVTGAGDGQVKLWSHDGRLLRTVAVGSHQKLAVSPRDPMFMVGKMGGRVELWSFEGKLIERLPRMAVIRIGAMAFAPSGEYLVACSSSSKVDYCQSFDRSGNALARIDHPSNGKTKSNITGIAVSPDGAEIYLAIGRSVHRYRNDGSPLGSFEATAGFLAALALSPDGELLATADSDSSRDGSVPHTRLWSADGTLIAEHAGHASQSVAFSRDGTWLVSGGSSNNTLLILDRSGARVSSFRVGATATESPLTVALAADKSRIITSDRKLDPVRVRLWMPQGAPAGHFRQSNSAITAMDVDPNSGLIVTASLDRQLRYWAADGRLLRSHPIDHDAPNLLAIAPNGRAVVAGGTEVTIFNAEGKSSGRIPVHSKGSRAAQFTPDARYLITGGIDGYVNLFFTPEPERSRRFVAHDGEDVTAIAIHPDGKRFATGSIWERFRIWNVDGERLADFKMTKAAKAPFSTLHSILFTPDGEELVVNTTRRGEEVRFYRLDGTPSRTLALPVANRYLNGGMAVSPDGRWLAVAVNRQIGLWDLETLAFSKALSGHAGWPTQMAFTADARHLISADSNGVIRVWDVASAQSYAMLSDGDEWVIYSDDGHFDSSRYGGDLVSMVSGLQAYSLDQFAVAFNRPDVLYQRIGREPPEVIEHFKGFHQRRLENLGTATIDLSSAPTVRITGHDRKSKLVTLTLETQTHTREQAFLQIHVNDVPIHEGRGRPIAGGMQQLEETVELTFGRNKIEASVVNQAGIESLRAPIYADYERAGQGDLYFVGLGVSHYRDSALNLSYADKDVEDMARLLARYEDHFGAVHSLTFTNARASRKALAEIEAFLGKATVDDTVVFLVSGHGGYEYGRVSTYYFLSHEADTSKLPQTAIPYDELEGTLSGIRPRRKLLLLDTCQSGEFDAATLQAVRKAAERHGLSVRSRERLISEVINRPRTYLYERDRYIYNNLSRRTGAVVFSSSLANESSLEKAALENGVFTDAVMRALTSDAADTDRDGFISVTELETAVKVTVARATGDLQHPEIQRDNVYQQIRLPLLR